MAKAPKNVYVVLLAGGTGTRLWPSSRKKNPKQFAKLFSRYTLFQETIRRVRGLVPLSHVFIITNKVHVEAIRKQEPMIPKANIIAEPEKKNTAMAMGVAAAYVHKKDPNAIIINLATDHLIRKLNIYHNALKTAAKVANDQNAIVSIGIQPTFPHTGYGYIKAGLKLTQLNSLPVYKVDSFVEKPDLKTAQKYIKTGKYYWNANNYVWPAKLILEEFKKLAPKIYKCIDEIYQVIGTNKEKGALVKQFSLAPSESIDYAISEKTKKLIIVPGKFIWDDIGGWKVIHDLSQKDKNGNSVIVHNGKGGHISIDTKNTLIQTEDQLIATVGINNLAIIDTKDALLICDLSKSQNVKKLVEILKEKKLTQYL